MVPPAADRLDDDTTLVATDAQLTAPVEDEQVILQRDSGVYFGVNAVGATCWEHLQEPTTLAALREAVHAEYDVAADRADRDLRAFLNDLFEADLIEIRDASDAA